MFQCNKARMKQIKTEKQKETEEIIRRIKAKMKKIMKDQQKQPKEKLFYCIKATRSNSRKDNREN